MGASAADQGAIFATLALTVTGVPLLVVVDDMDEVVVTIWREE
jgi:hypothetical protein